MRTTRRRKPTAQEFKTPPVEKVDMPTSGGRVSEVGTTSMFSILRDEYSQVTPEFQLEMLNICNYLAKFNGDVSYAVDNIVQLGNTPYSITFDEGTTDEKAKEMTAFLNRSGKHIYNGGINSLINDLFAQVAVNGALSAEMIPDRKLTKIETVSLVAPVTIRFKYNPTTYLYDPYQTVNTIISGSSVGNDNLKKLNTITYKYYALRRLNDNPTGIPEFISAFEMIELEKDMVCNMRHVIRKLGSFGFLNVLVNAPARVQGESETTYQNRLTNYLNKIRPDVEKGYASGIVLGFKNSHEFKVEGNELNVDGFHQLMELVTQMKMAGLKQDPLMLGRNFNVAETMARVIMAKLVTKIGNFQRLVASFMEDIFKLTLLMGGYQSGNVLVEFESPMVGDKLREEQAYEKRIENRKELRDTGIISQQQYAQEVNYEKPFADKDVDYTVMHNEDKPYVDPRVSTDPKADPNQVEDPTGSGSTNYRNAEIQMTLGAPEFHYGERDCNCGTEQFESADRIIESIVRSYASESHEAYSDAAARIAKLIRKNLRENGTGGSLQAMQDRVIYLLYNNWGELYSDEQAAITKRWIKKLYKEFTKDDGKLDELYLLLSAKALSYFEASDSYFLGRFISDVDTRRRINEFVAEAYSSNLDAEFQSDLQAAIETESWKVDRVITTTTNKLENVTNLIRLASSGEEQFILVSIKDSKRCKYCASMDGKVFSIQVSMDKLRKMVDGGPQTIAMDAPFITELFKGSEGEILVGQMTGDELQAAGFIGFTSHPNCRCKAVKIH